MVHRGRPRDEDQNSANLQNKTRAAMAERFGVSVRLINYFAQVLSENSKAVPTLQQVMSKEVRTVSRAVERVEREMAEAVEAAALADMLAQPLDETMTLHVAQIADILRLVPANTVDAIITPASIAAQLQLVEPGLGWSTIWEGSPSASRRSWTRRGPRCPRWAPCWAWPGPGLRRCSGGTFPGLRRGWPWQRPKCPAPEIPEGTGPGQ